MRIIELNKLKKDDRIKLLERSQINAEGVINTVSNIISDISHNGDRSLRYYSEKFDYVIPEDFRVPEEDIKNSTTHIDGKLMDALLKAAENIRKFHSAQIPPEWVCNVNDGISAGQIIRPMDTVGCYIPGGRAVYLSTILMTVIPAKIAGVPRVICCTPPDSNGKVKDDILAAASIAGADEIYCVGGAQAIAAMAYGTDTLPQVA